MKHFYRFKTKFLILSLFLTLTGCHKDIEPGIPVTVHGYVIHQETRDPLSNFQVNIVAEKGSITTHPGKYILNTRTDSNGYYSLEFVTVEGYNLYLVKLSQFDSFDHGFKCSDGFNCNNYIQVGKNNKVDFEGNTISLIKMQFANQDIVNNSDSITMWCNSGAYCSHEKCNLWAYSQEHMMAYYGMEIGDTKTIYFPVLDFIEAEVYFEIFNEKGSEAFSKKFLSKSVDDTITFFFTY